MKELFITILASFNVQALPDVHQEAWQATDLYVFDECVGEISGEAFYIERCISKQFPTSTMHVYNSYHCNGLGTWRRYIEKEHVNKFIKNGVVFDIPVEDLMSFYNIKQ